MLPAAPALNSTALLPPLAVSRVPTALPEVILTALAVATAVDEADRSNAVSHFCAAFVLGARTCTCQTLTGLLAVPVVPLAGYMPMTLVPALTGSTVVIAPA